MASKTARGTVVDANVILDVLGGEEPWRSWSDEAMAHAAREGPLVINTVIYAEISVGFERIEEADAALPEDYFQREPIPWPAAFLAGKAFVQYRRRGGKRRSPLPDFFIGAHAAVAGMRLLTRDPERYRTYFPRLHLIAP